MKSLCVYSHDGSRPHCDVLFMLNQFIMTRSVPTVMGVRANTHTHISTGAHAHTHRHKACALIQGMGEPTQVDMVISEV